jgi:hypothetical protein
MSMNLLSTLPSTPASTMDTNDAFNSSGRPTADLNGIVMVELDTFVSDFAQAIVWADARAPREIPERRRSSDKTVSLAPPVPVSHRSRRA